MSDTAEIAGKENARMGKANCFPSLLVLPTFLLPAGSHEAANCRY